jgi:hypothetical protein
MDSLKTIVTSLVTGAVISAATTFVIAKVTAKPPNPRCEVTSTKLPASECALVTRLAGSEAEQRAAATELRRQLGDLEETVRLTVEPRFFCATTGGARQGECFRTYAACATARAADQACWHQAEAVCFQAPDGANRCASAADGCVAMATTAGLGDGARAACHRTYVEAVVPPVTPPPVAPPPPARRRQP